MRLGSKLISKQLILFVFATLYINFLCAQVIQNPNVIHVTGSAEMYVIADEITLAITLTEYEERSKKVDMQSVESKFLEILKKQGLSHKDLNVVSSNNWQNWWSHRYDVFIEKNYTIKLGGSVDLYTLVKDLNFHGIKDLEIINQTNSEIQKYRKEVKIQAIKAAKEKADYLLEAVGAKTGKVLNVTEGSYDDGYFGYNRYQINNVSNFALPSQDTSNDGVNNVSKIKLRYEMIVNFEIIQ